MGKKEEKGIGKKMMKKKMKKNEKMKNDGKIIT